MDAAFKVQAKIRENARAIQDFTSDLSRWEESIKGKDEKLRRKKGAGTGQMPPPRGAQASKTVTVRKQASKAKQKGVSAADHTYDKGYKKWESFDVDQALEEVDQEERQVEQVQGSPPSPPSPINQAASLPSGAPLTPATIVQPYIRDSSDEQEQTKAAFPEATVQVSKPRDVLERERGNEYFAKGNMEQAVKFYTRAIGFNPKSVAAYSNRAMAYIKLNEYENARTDCSSALRLDETHVKSYMRRGTARNALGQHKAAFLDFQKVKELEPANKQATALCAKTREMIKNSARRAPRREIPIHGLTAQHSPLKENMGADAANSAASPSADETTAQAVVENKIPQVTGCPPVPPPCQGVPKDGAAKSAIQVANATAAAKASKQQDKSFLLEQAPKTLYEFTRVWNELKGQAKLRYKLLVEKLGGSGVSKLFSKQAPEDDIFVQMFLCLRGVDEQAEAQKALQIVQAISNLGKIDMAIMFMDKNEKASIVSIVHELCKTAQQQPTSFENFLKRLE